MGMVEEEPAGLKKHHLAGSLKEVTKGALNEDKC